MSAHGHLHRISRTRLLQFSAMIIALLLVLTACGDDETNTDANGNNLPGADFGRPVVFADLNWDSAMFHNRILQFIFEHGYGYETTTVPGGTIAMTQGLINGDIDIATEMTAEVQPPYAEAVENGTVIDHGLMFTGSAQGWFVPTYVIEGDEERGIEPMAPDLRHVDDLPEYAHLFEDPEDPDKGRFYDCIAGWECQKTNEAKFEAYGLNEHYNRFMPGSDTALAASIMSAVERGEPWFGYYWEPTWLFGMVDLTLLEEPEYTEECWDQIMSGEEACAYKVNDVNIATTPDFAESETEIVEFLEKAQTNVDQINAALTYMRENDALPEAAALWYLQEHQDVWTTWVPEDVADRVLAALAAE